MYYKSVASSRVVIYIDMIHIICGCMCVCACVCFSICGRNALVSRRRHRAEGFRASLDVSRGRRIHNAWVLFVGSLSLTLSLSLWLARTTLRVYIYKHSLSRRVSPNVAVDAGKTLGFFTLWLRIPSRFYICTSTYILYTYYIVYIIYIPYTVRYRQFLIFFLYSIFLSIVYTIDFSFSAYHIIRILLNTTPNVRGFSKYNI
jgi:hypothetical protein